MNETMRSHVIPSLRISKPRKNGVVYVTPGVDSKIRFSIDPLPGDDAFHQWKDAMKAVARLPMGIPPEFRKKVWLALADNHLSQLKVDWERTRKLAFNERSNPDDNKLGMQIVKDLHRTGCSGFSGTHNEQDRAVLKRVLLAYARWNKRVGYCQGFNVLAALVLDVMNRREEDALKVMIFLIDHVLPEGYFTNNLRALSVDMAVFRDLLHIQLGPLSRHLDKLQAAARDDSTGANYEPPLTNVFTMQWFLTLFATCLPKATALRVWDSVFLDGSEILLRTAVAIWGKLQDRIFSLQCADEFYTTMGALTQGMLDNTLIDVDDLLKTVYSMAPFPLPQLADLREKYTYNITPLSAAMSTGQRPHPKGAPSLFSDDDDLDDDEFIDNINCFTGIFPASQLSPNRNKVSQGELDRNQSASSFDISKASPGAYAAQPELIAPGNAYAERMTMDMDMLRKQYKRLRHRQKEAHIILTSAGARSLAARGGPHPPSQQHPGSGPHSPTHPQGGAGHTVAMVKASPVAPIQSPVAVNHLFIGRQGAAHRKNKTVAEAPQIAPFYPQGSKYLPQPLQCSRGPPGGGSGLRMESGIGRWLASVGAGGGGGGGGGAGEAIDPSRLHVRRGYIRSVSDESCASTLKGSWREGSVSESSACGPESDSFHSDPDYRRSKDSLLSDDLDLIDLCLEDRRHGVVATERNGHGDHRDPEAASDCPRVDGERESGSDHCLRSDKDPGPGVDAAPLPKPGTRDLPSDSPADCVKSPTESGSTSAGHGSSLPEEHPVSGSSRDTSTSASGSLDGDNRTVNSVTGCHGESVTPDSVTNVQTDDKSDDSSVTRNETTAEPDRVPSGGQGPGDVTVTDCESEPRGLSPREMTLNFEDNHIISLGSNFNSPTESPKRQSSPGSRSAKLTLLQVAQGNAPEGSDSDDTEPKEKRPLAASPVTPEGNHVTDHVGKPRPASDPPAEYVAALTFRGRKLTQSTNMGLPLDGGDHNPPDMESPTSPCSENGGEAAWVKSAPKVFNPFPSQHISHRRAKNGIKLGLYSADRVPKLETGIMKPSGLVNIGRAQHNACVHRHYMEEVRQQGARAAKR